MEKPSRSMGNETTLLACLLACLAHTSKTEKRYAQQNGPLFLTRCGFDIGACPPGTFTFVDGSTFTHGGSSGVHQTRTQGSSRSKVSPPVTCPNALYRDLQCPCVYQLCSTRVLDSVLVVATIKTIDLSIRFALPCPFLLNMAFAAVASKHNRPLLVSPKSRAIDIAPNNVEPAFTPA